MVPVLVQSLAVASVGILSPGSATISILLLMSEGGWRNGVAYMAGYMTMYSIIGAGVLVLGIGSTGRGVGEQGFGSSLLMIAFGALLLALAARTWHKPPADKAQAARFSSIIDSITPLKAFALAATIALINLKNLAIFLAALSVLLFSNLLLRTQLLILVPLVLIFCTSVVAPVLIYLVFPDRANDYLARIKQTIDQNSRPLGLMVMLLLGLFFLYRGVTGLS